MVLGITLGGIEEITQHFLGASSSEPVSIWDSSEKRAPLKEVKNFKLKYKEHIYWKFTGKSLL